MKKVKIISLTASMVLAMVFTFSCSDDGGGNNNTSICGDKEYNAAIYTCDKGELVGFCRGNSYYPEYQYCDSNGEIKEGTEISSSSLSSVGSSSSSVGGGQSSGSSSSVGGQVGVSSSSVGGGQGSSSSSSAGSQVGGSSSSVGGGQSSSSSSSVGGQVGVSSSSVGGGQSSSSSSSVGGQVGGSCVGFVDGTEREHYGKMKKQFCDGRDGQKYVYVTIGDQTWMAENLNYAPSSGNFISCDTYDCATYGRLYDWTTAMDCNGKSCFNQISSPHKGICPTDWHIPSDEEWDMLVTFAGGRNTAGKKLKAVSGWSSNSGTDDYGFSALPGGGNSDGVFPNVGRLGLWWSAYEFDGDYAYSRDMYYNYDNAGGGISRKYDLRSVRCVQD